MDLPIRSGVVLGGAVGKGGERRTLPKPWEAG
eukprot:CAMPEP_0204351912 /NCGR_PEP_ID=MMETSP0469-20131031/31486_1 /ASSEMBLY_ACC=CAM_ASM_000384 /TAXON_ID=2969 /ORGANISM="Oxyrrhis marina" /LENGTH=31 /DNA_ID= /DNA_START= /DNA_END= /DNA_ORIENTATION=